MTGQWNDWRKDWDRDRELWKLTHPADQHSPRLSGSNLIIAKMWIYQRDLEFWGDIYAVDKTDYGRALGKHIVAERVKGERSAEVAGHKAEQLEEVYAHHLAYRRAEQMVVANKEALKILNGQLEEWRTKQANERAANQFMAREHA